jgi:hypothetical protein
MLEAEIAQYSFTELDFVMSGGKSRFLSQDKGSRRMILVFDRERMVIVEW